MNELKPCPFCGDEARIDKHEKPYFNDDCYYIGCATCEIGFLADSEHQAIVAWNRRVKEGEQNERS